LAVYRSSRSVVVMQPIDRRAVLIAALGAAAGARAHQVLPWGTTRPAPALSWSDLSGKVWNLPALQGQAVLLNFWTTWCEPCLEEMPSLEALAKRHASESLVVLMVNYQEAEPGIRRFLERVPLALPVLLDRDGAATKAWTPRVFPTTVLIDRSGRPRQQVVGAVDWGGEGARQWVRELLGSGVRS
jgi:thiol-disulfide isomerase/thioredoxin